VQARQTQVPTRANNPGTQRSTTAVAEQRTTQLSRPDSQAQYAFQAGHLAAP
jgi:hypothetical protein